jgi:predicted Zn-dependent peptidase
MTESSEFQKSVLPGGIRLVSEKIPHVRSVALGVWLPLGSRYETKENNGISHFIEHMAFKGTPTRSSLDIAREIESGGGYVNAFTGKETVCFLVHVLDQHLPQAVEVLADIISNPLFAEEMIQHEKTVVLEEISDMEDNPEELIHEHFVTQLFPNNPMGLPILGNRDTVNSFTRQQLLNTFASHHIGNQMVIAAAGNLEHDALNDIIKDRFHFNGIVEDLPPYDSRGEQKGGNIQPYSPGRRYFSKEGILQTHICCGTQGLAYSNPQKFAFMILNTALGGGMSSRLFQNIREKFGFTYNVYSFADTFQETGLFGVYMGTEPGKTNEAIGLILKEFDDLRKEPLIDTELQRLKDQVKGNLMLGLEQVSSRMYRLAKMEIYLQEYLSLDDILHLIDKVTAEDVLAMAQFLLQSDQQLITILAPE